MDSPFFSSSFCALMTGGRKAPSEGGLKTTIESFCKSSAETGDKRSSVAGHDFLRPRAGDRDGVPRHLGVGLAGGRQLGNEHRRRLADDPGGGLRHRHSGWRGRGRRRSIAAVAGPAHASSGITVRRGERRVLAQDALLELSQLLAAALDRAGPQADELRETGRDWGRYLVGRPEAHDIAAKLPEVLEQIGFHARVREGGVELTGCPCSSILSGHPGLACCLAEGVIDGALAASGSPQRVGSAEHNPEQRHCHIELVHVEGVGPTSDRGSRSRRR